MTKENKTNKIQCHFVSSTHWDREWRYSMQKIRDMLVYGMDMLLDIFEKAPEYASFHLDSQTVPLQDYLEVRPEKEELIKKYVTEGRLIVGPWFCLPDEYCVGGESLIRNLLLGHKIANKFGKVSKTGFSPFGWGQISQMPQIYQGFGINSCSFYRGINTLVAPRSEIIWKAPDGTEILASRLAKRPRNNVFFVIWRPVAFGIENENDREYQWKNGNGPFKLVDDKNANSSFNFMHPRYEYHKEQLAERALKAIKLQDNDWSTSHRMWSFSHDSSFPNIREVDLAKDCKEAIKDIADVFHSNVKDFQDGVLSEAKDLPVYQGEMRHFYTEGSTAPFLGWVSSARLDIKRDNFLSERELEFFAEPLAAFASFLGAPHPQGSLDIAYNWLLQNHGHDDIGGCSRDIISKDMLFRSRQAYEIATCLVGNALKDITSSIDFGDMSSDEIAVVTYNPAPFKRTEVIILHLEIPKAWNANDIELYDEKGEKVEIQLINKINDSYPLVESKTDACGVYLASRYIIRALVKDIPSFGYKTFFVKGIEKVSYHQPTTMLTGPQTMENDYLAVTINTNGTLKVHDKINDRTFDNMGYFADNSAIGNPWERQTTDQDASLTTLNENAQVELVTDSSLQTTFKVTLKWLLPEKAEKDGSKRSEHLKPVKIVNTVSLAKEQKWVEVETEIDNTCEDHYLRISFPTTMKTDDIYAQGHFDVMKRSFLPPDFSKYDEPVQLETTMNSFIDAGDKHSGLAILNEGMKAYVPHDDPQRTVSLVAFRAFRLKLCASAYWTDLSEIDKDSQMIGKQICKYAIMPHSGNWEEGLVWPAAEQFNLKLHAGQAGPTPHGSQPFEKSFLKLKEENLHVSAVKKAEDGTGWVVRLFNPSDDKVKNAISLNNGLIPPAPQSPVEREQAEFALPQSQDKQWSKVQLTDLEELGKQDLEMDSDGWVKFEITAKKIMTLKFLPFEFSGEI